MADREGQKALVLGVGNILMGDEGLGVRAVELFEKAYDVAPGVDYMDGGVAGVSLVDNFKGYGHVIIVDAVNSGAAPATVHVFRDDEIRTTPQTAATAHQIGVKELIAIARFEGSKTRITLVGVVPEDISPTMGLSASVKAALPEATEKIAGELRSLGFEVRKKDA